ncbi:DUF4249 domain-containing protein [Ekhidna sp.]|uniref:DUF4249 domain-containing protein n=1 Tax=Ekhidna sp. TaxID=2608089 RepID=UPI003CCB8509
MRKYFTIFILFTACIEPYNLEVLVTRKVLVIDAIVTNLSGENRVRLEYSYSLDNSEPEQVSGAVVTVTDDLGNTQEFLQVSPGLYKPDDSFAGVVGRKYQLRVETPDGDIYESHQEELLEPGTVNDLYGKYLSLRSETGNGFERGIQFLVDIEGVGSDNYNYRFQYEENYSIEVPYESLYEFNPNTLTIEPRAQSIKVCYINEQSNDLLIATTNGQVDNELREFPIVFVDENDPELIGRYSITLKHYRITPAAYQFYKDLKENNESAGSFFDRQKGSFNGNIKNIADLKEPVLGYFEVAGVSKVFQIFDGGTWKEDGFNAQGILEFCNNQVESIRTADIISGSFDFGNRLIYKFADTEELLPGTFYNVETLLLPERCIDCRYYGTLEKPEFWD